MCIGLRVLLIRKEFKLYNLNFVSGLRLRVLLIRKEFKLSICCICNYICLRDLLISKEFKIPRVTKATLWFESLVNTEGIQTPRIHGLPQGQFESLVNTEGIQTHGMRIILVRLFESLVNTEGIQTCACSYGSIDSLRVLLIRKEFKRMVYTL